MDVLTPLVDEHFVYAPAQAPLPDGHCVVFGDDLTRTPYAVYLARDDWKQAIRRYTRAGNHAEMVLFRDRSAWCVEIAPLRRAQQEWALTEIKGRLRVDEAWDLVCRSSALLMQPIPVVRDRNSQEQHYQWVQRMLREELVRYRIAVATWITENSPFQLRLVRVPPSTLDGIKLVSMSEMVFLPTLPDQTLLLAYLIGDKFVACMPPMQVPADVEDAPLLTGAYITHPTKAYAPPPRDVANHACELLTKMWKYADPSHPALVNVGAASELFPVDAFVVRNSNGTRSAPMWLRNVERARPPRPEPVLDEDLANLFG